MAARKLANEVEKCFKKVKEGVAEFEAIYEKIQSCGNPSQKEKLEDSLKKEIKKLQRSRDQIKAWAASNDIKDKKPLLEYRKLIETQMEKFKAVEKEMKTKAYSKEGLSAASKLDPKEKEKLECCQFLSNMVEELERQIETREAEAESIQATIKKGKKDASKLNRISVLESTLERHKWHQNKLELLLRSLENGGVESEQVKNVEDGIRYYVESNEDADFVEDDSLYDEFNLQEEEDLYGMSNDVERVSSHDNQSVPDEAVDDSKSLNTGKVKQSSLSDSSTTTRRPSTQNKSPLPALASLHQSQSNTLANGSSTNGMKPAPILNPSGHLKYASAAAAAAASDKLNVGIAPLPPPASTTISSTTSQTAGSTTVKPVSGASTTLTMTSSAVTAATTPAPTLTSTVTTAASSSSSSSLTAKESPAMKTSVPLVQKMASVTRSSSNTSAPSTMSISMAPTLVSVSAASSSATPGTTSSCSNMIALGASVLPGVTSSSALPSAQTTPVVSSSCLDGSPNALGVEAGKVSSRVPSSAYSTNTGKTPSLTESDYPRDDNSNDGTELTSGGDQVKGEGNLKERVDNDDWRRKGKDDEEPIFFLPSSLKELLDSFDTQPGSIDSRPPDDRLLATSLATCPEIGDAERTKRYKPENPSPFTPVHFPQSPLPVFEDASFYSRVDTDTLFYLFYYRQGTYQQYLAAQALKGQSWRFHKQYQTWFQRHDEPKAITDEYEQGTYRFFDYESTWMNRRKADFRFHYRFLEDEL